MNILTIRIHIDRELDHKNEGLDDMVLLPRALNIYNSTSKEKQINTVFQNHCMVVQTAYCMRTPCQVDKVGAEVQPALYSWWYQNDVLPVLGTIWADRIQLLSKLFPFKRNRNDGHRVYTYSACIHSI